ncbi:MAG: DLW-39 family protein [Aeromicrobium sp.]
MKKLLMLAAAIGAAVFAINKKKAQAKPDAWSQASDRV